MTKNKGKLYAIYKNNEHKGNERAKNEYEAIKLYIIASGLSDNLNDISFIKQYSAVLAINGIHHHYIKEND